MNDELNDAVKNKMKAFPLPTKDVAMIRSIVARADGRIQMSYGVKFGVKWWLKNSTLGGGQ